MDAITPARGIGDNSPPVDKRTDIVDRIRDQQAAASAWLNEIREITDQEQADRAADFKRQTRGLQKEADAQRIAEKKPHDEAGAAIQTFWKPQISALEKFEESIDAKIRCWLLAEDRRIRREREDAMKAARDAEEAAEREAERASDLLMKAQSGELAGTGINTMAAVIEAEQAQEAAATAIAAANRLNQTKAGAGGNSVVGGIKRTVGLRVTRRVVLDLPPNAKPKITIVALQKLVPFIEENGEGRALREELGRLVNAIYKRTKEVAPGCKVVETEGVV